MVQYLIYFANIAVQLMFILFIGGIAEGNDCVGEPVLLWATSLLFFTFIVRDITESINIVFWLYHYPSEEEWTTMKKRGDKDLVICGMKLRFKIFSLCFIVIPKIVIICFLGRDGGRWLMHAQSNQDLILNCVALFFITDLDEIINKNLVSTFLTSIVEDMPDIETSSSGGNCSLYCGSIGSIIIITSMSTVAYTMNCGWDYAYANSNTTQSLNVSSLFLDSFTK